MVESEAHCEDAIRKYKIVACTYVALLIAVPLPVLLVSLCVGAGCYRRCLLDAWIERKYVL